MTIRLTYSTRRRVRQRHAHPQPRPGRLPHARCSALSPRACRTTRLNPARVPFAGRVA
jgi:hypothetical protein